MCTTVPIEIIVFQSYRFPNRVDTVTWTWNQPHSALAVLWLTLSQPFTRAEVEYLPPYHPSKEERAGTQFNGKYYSFTPNFIPLA